MAWLALPALLAPLWPASAGAAPVFAGVVTHVGDGDTLWVRVDGRDGKPVKLRLHGIDAPEPCQAWGTQATEALRAQALHRRVQVRSHVTDTYGRTVASVTLDGEDLAAWMVRQGHAWNDSFARRPGPCARQQHGAREAKRGLFADADAIEPRHFRRLHGPCPRPGASGPQDQPALSERSDGGVRR